MQPQSPTIRFGGPLTPAVKKLMIINAAVFLIQQAAGLAANPPGIFDNFFGLSFSGIFYEFKIWQLFTYMFLHGGFFHLFFNLLTLYMFAGELEEAWGSKRFVSYYIYSGIGAGIFISIMNFYIYENYMANPVTIGASGALYAVLLAYGLMWPNREVLLYFLIPVKIKYLVLGFGLLEFFGSISTAAGKGGNISHIGHLGGLFSGFIILYFSSKAVKNRYQAPASSGGGFISGLIRKYRLNKKRKLIEKRIKAKRIIDEMLAKIARDGMGSLSATEKRDLEWARKNFSPGTSDTIH